MANSLSERPTATSGFDDNRPAATLRMLCEDVGIVLRSGPEDFDKFGARDAWMWEADGLAHVHYDGAGDEGWRCCLATSRDLLHWEKHGPVLDFGPPGSPDHRAATYGVTWQQKPGEWHLFYLGTPNVSDDWAKVPAFPYLTLKATGPSPRGPWTKHYAEQPFAPLPGTYCGATASPGHIIRHDGQLLQFFSASMQEPRADSSGILRTLGIARAPHINGPWVIDPEPILPLAEQIENTHLYFEEANQTWFLFTNHIGCARNSEGFLDEWTDAVWVYWTKDLNHWDPANKAIVLDGENCEWSRRCIGLPTILRAGDRLAIIYDAPGGDSTSHMHRHLGLAWLNLPLQPPT